jgi:uncharacterized protein (DUF952 family)
LSYIYHIVEKDYFHAQEKKENYVADSLEEQGFIHFSKTDQLLQVANSFYKGKNQLYILKVDENALTAELKMEPPLEAPNSGMLFPHLYGPLNWNAVVKKFDWHANDDGTFSLPDLN